MASLNRTEGLKTIGRLHYISSSNRTNRELGVKRVPNKDDLVRRKCRNYPHFCAEEVPDDWADWNRRLLEMDVWCRQRVGPDGFAKQGRMGAVRNSLEYRFKSPDIAVEFQSAFGGKVSVTETP